MSDPRNQPREPGETPFAYMRRRRRSRGPGPAVLGVLALLIVLGGLGWYWFRAAGEPDPTALPADAAPTTTASVPDDPGIPPLDLPALEASDAFIRGLIQRLSSHPQLAAWLVTDELVHRFVGTVVNLAGSGTPSSELPFLIPDEEFRVRESGGRLVIDPASHRRYDLLTETFLSLDTQGSARLYHQLHPLFDEAYRELGIPDSTFDETFSLAVANLVSAEVPPGALEVEPVEGVYEFANPALEARSDAEKHLIRMGPDNARRVQEKLRELSRAIGIEMPQEAW